MIRTSSASTTLSLLAVMLLTAGCSEQPGGADCTAIVPIHMADPDTVNIWPTLQELRNHVDIGLNDTAIVQAGWEQWHTTDSALPEQYRQVVWLVSEGNVKQVILDPDLGMGSVGIDSILAKAQSHYGPPDTTIVERNPLFEEDQETAGKYGGIVWQRIRKVVWYDRGCVDVQYMITDFTDRLKHLVISLGAE